MDVLGTAKSIAANSSLIGSSSGWVAVANVNAQWTRSINTKTGLTSACPPVDNNDVVYVTITMHHTVPIFFPFVQGNGSLSTSAQFRMEPTP